MKYIRTKDGIFKDKPLEIKYTKNGRGGYSVEVKEKDIIKIADTIEELCDEFVVIGIFENQIGCCCNTFDEAKELKDYVELPQEQIIYGAIWTDKGLIYKAKMNDKGELELL